MSSTRTPRPSMYDMSVQRAKKVQQRSQKRERPALNDLVMRQLCKMAALPESRASFLRDRLGYILQFFWRWRELQENKNLAMEKAEAEFKNAREQLQKAREAYAEQWDATLGPLAFSLRHFAVIDLEERLLQPRRPVGRPRGRRNTEVVLFEAFVHRLLHEVVVAGGKLTFHRDYPDTGSLKKAVLLLAPFLPSGIIRSEFDARLAAAHNSWGKLLRTKILRESRALRSIMQESNRIRQNHF
jgi:hypothetical protein